MNKITNKMSEKEVLSFVNDFYKLFYENEKFYIEIDELKKTLNFNIKDSLKNSIKKEIDDLNNKIIEFESEQKNLIISLINYIFDNNIDLKVKVVQECSSSRDNDGGYPLYNITTFESELGQALYNLIHENQLFSLYYEGKKLPKEYDFTNKNNKEDFLKTLNLYVCEGEPI